MGSTHRAQTFHFWCLILVCGGLSSRLPSLLPVGPVPSRAAQGPSPRPCGQNGLAWSPAGQTGHSPLVLGSPESALLPSGQSQGPCFMLNPSTAPLSFPVLCPIHVVPWGWLRPGLKRLKTVPPSFPSPWPQDRQPAPPERERLFLGLPEHQLSPLSNWSCSRLSEDFMKSAMCIFPSGSP